MSAIHATKGGRDVLVKITIKLVIVLQPEIHSCNCFITSIYCPLGLIIWLLNLDPVTLHERPLEGPLTLLIITQPPSFHCSNGSHGCPSPMAHQPPPRGLQQVFLSSSPLALPLPLSLSLVSVAPGERLILDIQRIAAFVSEI